MEEAKQDPEMEVAPQAEREMVVAVPVGQLKPNVYNPNQQSVADFELLVTSMRADGFTLPVIVNDGKVDPSLKDMIVDGEHRWRAAMVLGMAEVPVIYKSLDQAGMRFSTLRHNEARGHHDALMEAQVLKSLTEQIGGADVAAGLGMDWVELDAMLKKAEDFASAEDVSALSMDENMAEMAGRNVTGEDARIIAGRHSIIDATKVTDEQETKRAIAEAGQNVRIELVYSGEEAEVVKRVVASFASPYEAVMNVCGVKDVPPTAPMSSGSGLDG